MLLINLPILLYISWFIRVVDTGHYTNSILITVAKEDFELVNKVAESYDLKYQRQILPRVHEYEIKSVTGIFQSFVRKKLKAIKEASGSIIDIYHQKDIRLPVETKGRKLSRYLLQHVRKRSLQELLVCSPYYGMHIMEAWSNGYRGEGIVVGVVDTGVEVSHVDLKPNIDIELSRSFVKGKPATDVNPDILPSYQEFDIYSDHGNNCAGLIAAIQGNGICSSGVAPDAKIAALKFLEIEDPMRSLSIFKFRPSSLVEALTYRNDQIHIYSNSYGPEDFSLSTAVVNEAFKEGATQGRNGKGSIYIIATGNKGPSKNVNMDGFVNSIYTIAISSVGVNGMIPIFGQPGSCILAATYGEGLNNYSTEMVTISHKNSCTNEFKRTSASAAIASGMTALALQANADLTWRDVQHIIINTSSSEGLEGSDQLVTNAAGYAYHQYFGFGLINASALVFTAKRWKNVPSQNSLHATLPLRDSGRKKPVHSTSTEICKLLSDCPFITEHVLAYIEYWSYYDQLVEFELCAPTNTCSMLLTRQVHKGSLSAKRVKRQWSFMSLQFWGENPKGKWDLKMYMNTNELPSVDKRYSVTKFNLTVYGYFKDSKYVSEMYDEIIEYAERKVDEIADVLDIKIPDGQKQTGSKVWAIIKSIFFGAGALSLVLTLVCIAPLETGYHIREQCIEKCYQFYMFLKDRCRKLYMWVVQIPNLFYRPVNTADENDT